MTGDHDEPIDFLDFREVEFIPGDPPVFIGWRIDWDAYHAACDRRDAQSLTRDKGT